jgi:hypothetical protein
MTAEQAANHPSKNVISRALGAESDVDVDMRVIEVDDGTEFLLCSDGITRHIPDHELRQLLLSFDELTEVCEEMKRRCFERGAEDNLTAVLVCVGTPISTRDRAEDLEKTISPETTPLLEVPAVAAESQPPVDAAAESAPLLIPASRKAFPGLGDQDVKRTSEAPLNIGERPRAKSGVERTMTRFFVFVLFLCALGGAFYAGRRYRGPIPYLDQSAASNVEVSSAPANPDDSSLKFENARREVDTDASAWLVNSLNNELTRQGIQNPLQSSDPQFLYLYGRASLLTGNSEEAAKAFEAAIVKADLNPSPSNAVLRKEATLGLAAAALKSEIAKPAALNRLDEITRKSASQSSSPLNSPSSPSSSP